MRGTAVGRPPAPDHRRLARAPALNDRHPGLSVRHLPSITPTDPFARAGPEVRIRLPPAASQERTVPLPGSSVQKRVWRRTRWPRDVTSLLIRMEFLNFADYWLPLISEGPVAKFVAGLSASAHATLVDHARRAYLANLPDGPRSFACVAWACRGTMPSLSGSVTRRFWQ